MTSTSRKISLPIASFVSGLLATSLALYYIIVVYEAPTTSTGILAGPALFEVLVLLASILCAVISTILTVIFLIRAKKLQSTAKPQPTLAILGIVFALLPIPGVWFNDTFRPASPYWHTWREGAFYKVASFQESACREKYVYTAGSALGTQARDLACRLAGYRVDYGSWPAATAVGALAQDTITSGHGFAINPTAAPDRHDFAVHFDVDCSGMPAPASSHTVAVYTPYYNKNDRFCYKLHLSDE